jgi:hypothetical protein
MNSIVRQDQRAWYYLGHKGGGKALCAEWRLRHQPEFDCERGGAGRRNLFRIQELCGCNQARGGRGTGSENNPSQRHPPGGVSGIIDHILSLAKRERICLEGRVEDFDGASLHHAVTGER